jgi:hypothetical protein
LHFFESGFEPPAGQPHDSARPSSHEIGAHRRD